MGNPDENTATFDIFTLNLQVNGHIFLDDLTNSHPFRLDEPGQETQRPEQDHVSHRAVFCLWQVCNLCLLRTSQMVHYNLG